MLEVSTHPKVAEARGKLYSASFPNSKKLVYACSGIGGDALKLHKYFEKIKCIDMDERAIQLSKKLVKEHNLKNVEVERGDVTSKELLEKINDKSLMLVTPFRSFAKPG